MFLPICSKLTKSFNENFPFAIKKICIYLLLKFNCSLCLVPMNTSDIVCFIYLFFVILSRSDFMSSITDLRASSTISMVSSFFAERENRMAVLIKYRADFYNLG